MLLALVLAPPVSSEAQQAAKVYRLGYLSSHPPQTFRVDVLRQALHELGWVEGRNLVIDYRTADGKISRLPALAAELVRLKPDVIVAVPTVSALAAQRATQEIPIVFTHVSDPVGSGLVQSLPRPAANVTGLTHLNTSLNPKRLEILWHAVPKRTHIAAIWQPGGLGEHTERLMLKQTEAAAGALGVGLQFVEARGFADVDAAFATAVRARPGAIFVLPGPVFLSDPRRVVELAATTRLPTMYFAREFAEVGGLMSYGADMTEILRRAASYVDRLLKGARPADLPVEQGSKFELVINLKTAKALDLTIPASLLLRADHVIE
ncbi:MAG TPA: ABC transporter substrate-binding protein [Methylomirabilota bacterium]|jgi:putative ABC transport system substrate-binding protein